MFTTAVTLYFSILAYMHFKCKLTTWYCFVVIYIQFEGTIDKKLTSARVKRVPARPY